MALKSVYKYILIIAPLALLLRNPPVQRQAQPMPARRPVSVSAIPSPQPSVAKKAEALRAFNELSTRPWRIERNSAGYIERLSGGSYPAGPGGFLETFGHSLFGVGKDSLHMVARETRPSSTQEIYEQAFEGLPVWGSRINLHYAPGGSLIYAAATIYPGRSVHFTPKFNQAEAAGAVLEALPSFLGAFRPAAEGDYPFATVTALARPGFSLSGGLVFSVYRFEIPLREPLHGTLEAVVDAQTKNVVVLRLTDKN